MGKVRSLILLNYDTLEIPNMLNFRYPILFHTETPSPQISIVPKWENASPGQNPVYFLG